LIASMSLAGGALLHLGFIGALNIAVSYGLTKKKRWDFTCSDLHFTTGAHIWEYKR